MGLTRLFTHIFQNIRLKLSQHVLSKNYLGGGGSKMGNEFYRALETQKGFGEFDLGGIFMFVFIIKVTKTTICNYTA